LYGADGASYAAPSGDYLVQATFASSGSMDGASTTVTQETRFRWNGAEIRFGALTRGTPIRRRL